MRQFLQLLGRALLLLGVALGLWTLFPLPRTTVDDNITFNGQEYRLVFSAPKTLRRGEASVVTLELEAPPTLPRDAALWWQASLVGTGFMVDPPGDASQPIVAGKVVSFRWKIKPTSSEHSQAALWLHIIYAPKNGAKVRFTIFTTAWEMGLQWLAGLSAFTARLLTVLILLLGFALLRGSKTMVSV